jgi:hypothetical protein
LFHYRNEVCLTLGATAAAVELGALLDRKRHMVDVAVNLRRGLEGDRLRADDARDRAAHDNLSTRDHPRYLAPLADDYFGRVNVAFDLTIHLQQAPADDPQSLANDLEVVANDRLFAT